VVRVQLVQFILGRRGQLSFDARLTISPDASPCGASSNFTITSRQLSFLKIRVGFSRVFAPDNFSTFALVNYSSGLLFK
jgi:hypothetical protein